MTGSIPDSIIHVIDNIKEEDLRDILADATEIINSNAEVKSQLNALEAKRSGLRVCLNNLYPAIEKTGSDDFGLERLSLVLKTELKTVEKEILQLQLVPEIKVTIDELQNCWHDFLTVLKQKTDLTLVKVRSRENNIRCSHA